MNCIEKMIENKNVNKYMRQEKNFDVMAKPTNICGQQITLYGIYSKPDKDGERKEIYPCMFTKVHGMHNGAAVVECVHDGCFVKYGFINENGKVIVPCEYDDAFSDVVEGAHKVGKRTKNGKMVYGYVDNQNYPIVMLSYNANEATKVLIEHLQIKDYEKRVNVD